MSSPLYFIHISDSHLGATKDWAPPPTGNNPYDNLQRIVLAINHLPTQPQFVLHTGDVANHNTEKAYEFAGEIFSQLTMPSILFIKRGPGLV